MYSAQNVANFVLQTQRSFGCPVNNFKLQQILYFVQANFSDNTQSPLLFG